MFMYFLDYVRLVIAAKLACVLPAKISQILSYFIIILPFIFGLVYFWFLS